MSRDLTKLAQEWKEHPCLQKYACKNVEELAEMLENHHKALMGPYHMNSGYLYQKQVERNKQLSEYCKQLERELEQCRQQTTSK